MTKSLRLNCFVCLLSAGLITSCGSKQATIPGEQPAAQSSPTEQATPQSSGAKPSAMVGSPSPGFTPRHTDASQSRPQATSVPAGTVLHVRLAQSLDTKTNRAGDHFTATVSSPVSIEGKLVIPQGTVVAGHISTSGSSGRLKGRAVMGLSLDSFTLDGKVYKIETTHASRAGSAHKKRNLGFIAGGSGLGAVLGAIAGGPKGALIGAGAGAAAGTAGAALTGKKNVHVPAESLLSFSLVAPVAVP